MFYFTSSHGHMIYQMTPFSVSFSERPILFQVLASDMVRRMVSLRQLSFLYLSLNI